MTATTDITRERIAATEAVIRPHIRRTPLVHADLADFGLPAAPVTFKLEMLQHSGSFKARGAFANLLLRKPPAAGVVAASGGNHGVAVAYAAQRLGIPATIFVPDITSPAKAERIRRYGAKLVIAGTRIADAFAASEAHVEQSGAMAVHPFDQVETMLGQGIGRHGGGAGRSRSRHAARLGRRRRADRRHRRLVFGTGSHHRGRAGAGADIACGACRRHAGRCAGRRYCRRQPGAPRVGRLTFPIAKAHVAQALLVSDDAIRQAQAALWSALRVVAEPGAATAVRATAVTAISAGARRAHRRGADRRQYDGGEFRRVARAR